MKDIKSRLVRCFAAVFPDLPAERIPEAGQPSTTKWDSIVTATLFTLIEEEFGIVLDWENFESLDSFAGIYELLCQQNSRKDQV